MKKRWISPCAATLAAAAFFLVFAVGGSPAAAAEPQVTVIEPYGVPRGASAEVVLRGNRLADAQELLFYSSGIAVESLAAEGDNLVRATLAVAADCPLGLHALRLRTASGISNLRLLAVGALPEVAEEEPNGDFASPQPIPLGVTVTGVIEAEDVDYFVVEAKQGERITAEVEGLRLGYEFFDPYLAILNAQRFELAASDDAPLVRQDCVASIIAPADGKYIIQLREVAFGGSPQSRYRLHVGQFPRPLAVYPPGGRPGEEIEITWIGDAGGAWKERITLPADADGDTPLYAQNAYGVAPSPNVVRVNELPVFLEVEPNDARAEATPAEVPGALCGIISQKGDVDHFRFAAKKDQEFDVRVFARNPMRSPLDSVIDIFRATGGARVAGNDDDRGLPDSYVRFRAPEDDDYILLIRDHLRGGGPEYVYRVEITPVEPSLSLTLPERVQYVPVTVSVPRGNRMAVMLGVRREGFSGPVDLRLDGLPAGVTVDLDAVTDRRNDVPVLFEAAPDAPLAGGLVSFEGSAAVGPQQVTGRLLQRTMLVRGQNDRDVWGHDATQLAAAVTEAAPFHIDLVPPKAPLVRNGQMQLKVVAQRAEGFDAPIAVQLLYNPPGVGSSAAVRINPGETEALIPLTAGGNAELNTWRIAVLGRAPIGGGNLDAATGFVDLTVADSPFNMAVGKSAAEQGGSASLAVALTHKEEFPGEAVLELVGLPAGAQTQPKMVTGATESVAFDITVAEDARPGRFTNVICRATVLVEGEPMQWTIGGGELRIDPPLPATAAAPAASGAAATAPAADRPLSRLEQLRQVQE